MRKDQKRVQGGETTNYGDKSRKGFLAVTLVTVLSIVSVIGVYAVFLGSYTGGEVTVGGMGSGNVMYSSVNADPGTWTSTLSPSGAGIAWYSRIEIATGGYSGPVTIAWQLQQKTGASSWTDVTDANATTSMVLTGGAQNVYATSDGAYAAGNHDWGPHVAAAGTYRVFVSVGSA